MKTLLALLLSLLAGFAATPKTVVPTPQTDAASAPVRKLGERWVDLRPLARHMTAPGWASRPMPAGCEGWEPHYSAKVISVGRDGLILDSFTPGAAGRRTIYLRNLPDWQLRKDGDRVSFLAHNFGTYNYQSVGGSRTVAGYDYGTLPTPEEKADMDRKSAEITAAHRAAVKADLDRKVSEAKERAEKARAEREKKP